jgi:alanine dehydrogenase
VTKTIISLLYNIYICLKGAIMKIGLPKEIKNNENRVGLTPEAVKKLVRNKNQVFVQKGAGVGSGFSDNEYIKAGAHIVPTAKDA